MSAAAIAFPVLFPILAGALLPLLRFQNRRHREIYIGIAVVINSLVLLALLLNRPAEGFTLFRLAGPLEIAFRLDGLGCVFAGLVAFLWPVASLYAFEYIKHEGGDDKFFCFYTISYGVTVGIASSANLITLYLFYELLTLATLPLVMHAMDRRSVAAGKKYLLYSIGGAAMAFMGMMILYVFGNPSLHFVYGGFVDAAGEHQMLLLAGYVLMFLGFGVKAAVFPFYAWLPAAGVAPTPVTALLHAVAVVKAGVFAILRTIYFCFGPALLAGTWAQHLTMALAIFTIVFGSSMALREQHLKRRLAYSTVSNLSYIAFGATLMTPAGLTGALAHMLFHGVMKITLFFCVGAVMYKTHKEYVPEIDGFGRKMPITFLAFTIGSMGLIGIPIFPGFLSKWQLASAAVATGAPLAYLGVLALILSAILTAGYLLSIVLRAYFPGAGFDAGEVKAVHDPNWYMTAPFIVLCAAMLFLGMGSGGLLDLLGRIAAGAF